MPEKIKILWFSWKDIKHPNTGGAELTTAELLKRLVQNGYEVILITSNYKAALKEETIDGYKIVRVGGKFSVYFLAYRYYKKNLQGWADLVVDECNTLPFFCKFYVKEKNVFWIQQFAREIWFYQMILPINFIGYILEPLYLRLFKDRPAFTFAESTKKDLIDYGFDRNKIEIVKEAMVLESPELASVKKFDDPSILFLSAIREMKRPDHVLRAFEIAKKNIKNLKLNIVGGGNGKYFQKVMRMIDNSPYKNDIKYWGAIPQNDKNKIMLMQKSHFICCASVREGWGIIVSEAGSQGTPAIVYNVNGLKDAVDYGRAGLITDKNTPHGLAEKIIEGFDKTTDYASMQKRSFEFAKKVNIETTYDIFLKKISSL